MFNKSKFELVQDKALNLNYATAGMGDLPNKTNQVAHLMYFKSLADIRRSLILVNLHLHWNPMHDAVKYAQAAYVLKNLHEFKQEIEDGLASEVIVCGDFNSRPESSVVRLMTNQEPSYEGEALIVNETESVFYVEKYMELRKA